MRATLLDRATAAVQKYGRMKLFLSITAMAFCALVVTAGELQEAAAAGDIAKVRTLIQANPTALNAREAGTTALHEASRAGHLEMVKLLVTRGANVNAEDISRL